jgi:hypothetical protein
MHPIFHLVQDLYIILPYKSLNCDADNCLGVFVDINQSIPILKTSNRVNYE